MRRITLTGKDLLINDIYDVAHSQDDKLLLNIAPQSLEAMKKSREYVFKIVKDGKPVYSINTGFGALSNKKIEDKDLAQLQVNLIRSHCTGVGEAFGREVVRAIMLLRANCLCSGYSGINPHIVELLLRFIEKGVTPFVPTQGSVGASGDLAPLSHIALTLIGEGKVFFKNQLRPSSEVIIELGLRPAVLGPKDGLALINGTAVMAALGSLALYRAEKLVKLADVAACLTNEAVRGTKSAYHPNISLVKPHPGQLDCVHNLNLLLEDSEIRQSHTDCGKVQDPYSIRCVPQVHGASRQTLKHAKVVLDHEINAVTDNPLIFPDEELVLSGGNFHGEAIALCMDYLAMGLSELCNISERRIEKMMNPVFSELPPFLTENAGLNSGLMIAHVTAAALASENKVHCHPASVDSIPTSTDKEDHVSMGITAGLKLQKVVENLENVLAIEFLCNTQALEFLRPMKASRGIEALYTEIRQKVPKIEQDRTFYEDIQNIKNLIHNNTLINTVEKEIGVLK